MIAAAFSTMKSVKIPAMSTLHASLFEEIEVRYVGADDPEIVFAGYMTFHGAGEVAVCEL